MCLIAFAWQASERYPLVVIANRDEFFDRPADAAQWWHGPHGEIFAGRDAKAGGSWMGVGRNGRFAALTNFRDPRAMRADAPSRGALVPEFVAAERDVEDSMAELAGRSEQYNGFNLLMYDGHRLGVFESTAGAGRRLAPGVYALSNAGLDSPWPKQRKAIAGLREQLATVPEREALFALLRDDRPAPDAQLPETGIALGWERMLSSAFIRAPGYGTRCSTVMLLSASGEFIVEERSWGHRGEPIGVVCERFEQASALA